MIDLDKLEALARAATPGSWEVQVDERPHHRGGAHIERRIRTSWEHDQLKAPYPVITTSVGIGVAAGGPAHYMVSLGENDAAHIAATNPTAVLELIALARQAAGPDTVAIPLVSGEELLARTQPLPKWIDDMKGSGPTTDSLIEYIEQLRAAQPAQQPAPLAGQEPLLVQALKDIAEACNCCGDRHDLAQIAQDALDAHIGDYELTKETQFKMMNHRLKKIFAANSANGAQAGELSDAGIAASVFEQAAQACDQQADGTNGPYRSACLQCANAVRALRDDAANAEAATPTSQETPP